MLTNSQPAAAAAPKAPLSQGNEGTQETPLPVIQVAPKKCSLCQIEFSGDATYLGHLEGQAHKKKQLEKKVEEALVARGILTPQQVKNKVLECNVCNLKTNSYIQFKSHIEGTKHKNKLALLTPGVKVMPTSLFKPSEVAPPKLKSPRYCRQCNLTLNSETQLNQHLESKRHKAGGAKPKFHPYPRITTGAAATPKESGASLILADGGRKVKHIKGRGARSLPVKTEPYVATAPSTAQHGYYMMPSYSLETPTSHSSYGSSFSPTPHGSYGSSYSLSLHGSYGSSYSPTPHSSYGSHYKLEPPPMAPTPHDTYGGPYSTHPSQRNGYGGWIPH